MQKLKQLITSLPALQGMLKEVFQTVRKLYQLETGYTTE